MIHGIASWAMDASVLREHDLDHRVRVAISKGGQVTIPADVRRRWGTVDLELIDLGERIVLCPVRSPGSPAKGSVRLPAGVTTTSLRERARAEDGDR